MLVPVATQRSALPEPESPSQSQALGAPQQVLKEPPRVPEGSIQEVPRETPVATSAKAQLAVPEPTEARALVDRQLYRPEASAAVSAAGARRAAPLPPTLGGRAGQGQALPAVLGIQPGQGQAQPPTPSTPRSSPRRSPPATATAPVPAAPYEAPAPAAPYGAPAPAVPYEAPVPAVPCAMAPAVPCARGRRRLRRPFPSLPGPGRSTPAAETESPRRAREAGRACARSGMPKCRRS